MPSLTREEAAALGRRQAQPVKAADELLAVWVPGKLVNPLNASAWGWQKRSRYARGWKNAVAQAIWDTNGRQWNWPIDRLQANTAKRIHFLANTGGRMDGDGLQAALKPIRDALIDCAVLHSDAPDSGHEFVYTQRIDRARRGCEIRVSLRPPKAAPHPGADGPARAAVRA